VNNFHRAIRVCGTKTAHKYTAMRWECALRL